MQNDTNSKSSGRLAQRRSCGKWRVASNLHSMAEGERAAEPSREVPPIAVRGGGSSPSAPVVELREPKSPMPSGMRGRIAVVIGLLLAATLLYIGLFALLHRHQPAVESVANLIEMLTCCRARA